MTQETETVSLLPCPFCGSQPECFPSGDGTGTMIECISPDCVHPHVSYYGDGEAARRWNTRVSTNKDETIAKLREALDFWRSTHFFVEHDEEGSPTFYSEAEAVQRAVRDGGDVQMAIQATFRALTSTEKEG